MTHSTTLILSLVFIVQINAGMQDAETNNHLLLMIAILRIRIKKLPENLEVSNPGLYEYFSEDPVLAF